MAVAAKTRSRPGVREPVSGRQPDWASRVRTQTVGLGVAVSGGKRLGSRPAIGLASTADGPGTLLSAQSRRPGAPDGRSGASPRELS
ncbi:hypothetical protein VTN02DRAFT_1144 [Thermoascus thermophilus]